MERPATRKEMKEMLNGVYRFASKNWKHIKTCDVEFSHTPQERFTSDSGGFIEFKEGPKRLDLTITTYAPK